uniref:TACC_C domain-containing protein n=1 Tax=Parastrongyloides trichosuri TaxID=131310 RepID=A0A0N4ZV08_PARTI
MAPNPTINIRSASTSRNGNNSRIPISQTPTRVKKNNVKSDEDLSKTKVVTKKNIFGSTGSLNKKSTSQERLNQNRLGSSKNTISDDSLNRIHITKRNVIKAQPLKASTDNISLGSAERLESLNDASSFNKIHITKRNVIKAQPLKASTDNISLGSAERLESLNDASSFKPFNLSKQENDQRAEKLCILMNKITEEEQMETPNLELINQLKGQCNYIIFKGSVTEKWILYFKTLGTEFKKEEELIDSEVAELEKGFESITIKINEFNEKMILKDQYKEKLEQTSVIIENTKAKFKIEKKDFEKATEEVFNHFNDGMNKCIYNKCNEINNSIKKSNDEFINSSKETCNKIEKLINEFTL